MRFLTIFFHRYQHILSYLRTPLPQQPATSAPLPRDIHLLASPSRVESLLDLRDEALFLGLDELARSCNGLIATATVVPAKHHNPRTSLKSSRSIRSTHSDARTLREDVDSVDGHHLVGKEAMMSPTGKPELHHHSMHSEPEREQRLSQDRQHLHVEHERQSRELKPSRSSRGSTGNTPTPTATPTPARLSAHVAPQVPLGKIMTPRTPPSQFPMSVAEYERGANARDMAPRGVRSRSRGDSQIQRTPVSHRPHPSGDYGYF